MLTAVPFTVSVKLGDDVTSGADLANFDGTDEGVVNASNWNKYPADVFASGVSNPLNSDGDTVAGLSFSSDTSIGGANANFAPHVGGMYYGHAGTGSSDVNATISFADFGTSPFSAGFDLYVYAAHGNADLTTEGLSVSAAGTTKFVKGNQRLYITGGGFLEGTGTTFAATEEGSNYVVFSGLGADDLSGGDLVFTVAASNVNRTALNGFQMVAVPEPSSSGLIMLGATICFAVFSRRRRQ
jgi:hypothetical protein